MDRVGEQGDLIWTAREQIVAAAGWLELDSRDTAGIVSRKR
jgi:hypothetical protein